MNRYYADVLPNGRVHACYTREDPEEGPPSEVYPLGTAYPIDAPINWAPSSETCHLYRREDGTFEWVEAALTASLISSAIARTYADVDAVYLAAVGQRTIEYTEAEAAARAFKAANYVGPVSEYISDHAKDNPTGLVQTNEWATQQIIERADAFNWAKMQLRKVRFARQNDMRAATTSLELAQAVATWDDFIQWLRGVLGL